MDEEIKNRLSLRMSTTIPSRIVFPFSVE